MSNPYVGEIRMFAGNFAPQGWAFCDGQLLPIFEYETLFNLFGTLYGGDGEQTFGVPNMAGRLPIHSGTGPGLSSRTIGEEMGVEQVTLTAGQLPPHTHSLNVSSSQGTTSSAVGGAVALATSPGVRKFRPASSAQPLRNDLLASTGGSQPHTNMMPSTCVNFIVSLFGIFPSPS